MPSASTTVRRAGAVRRGAQRLGQPAVHQQRRVDAVREVAQLLHRLLEIAPIWSSISLRPARDRRRGCRAEADATASATRCCCAPSCRSRSIRRRSASAASTMRARGTPAARRARRTSSSDSCSAESSHVVQRERHPAGELGERLVVGLVERQRVRRRARRPPAPSTLPPCRAGANRSCRSAAVPRCSWPTSSRGTHSRSQPGPATPHGAACPVRQARAGRRRVGVGVQRAGHDERAVQARVGPGAQSRAGPRPARPGRSSTSTRESCQSRRIDSASVRSRSSTGLPRPALSAKSASSSSGERRTACRAARVRRAARRANGPAHAAATTMATTAGRHPARGARGQPAEQEQQREQPEEDRRADRRDRLRPRPARRCSTAGPGRSSRGDPATTGSRENRDGHGARARPRQPSARRAGRPRRRRAARR